MPELPTSPFVSSRRARRTTWTRRVAVAVAVIALIVVLWTLVLAVHARLNLQRLDLASLGQEPEPAVVVSEPGEGERNVLVTTVGPSPAGAAPRGTPETVAIVHTSDVREDVVVISFPPDLRVEIPGRGNQLLTTAYVLGGPALLAETVERYSGMPLDRYVEIDLDRIVSVADRLGGVQVCLDAPVSDTSSGTRVPEGRHVLGAEGASTFLRADADDPEAHALRAARQQVVLAGVLERATAGSTLVHPARAWAMAGQLTRSVRADRGTAFRTMLGLAWSIPRADGHRLRTVPVPTDQVDDGSRGRPEDAEALFQALRTGAEVPGAVPTAGQETSDANAIPLLVLNGAGVAGLAAEAAEQLVERGFEIVGTDNAGSFEVEATEVRHRAEDAAAARALAEHLPGSELVEGDGPEDELVVVVGHAFAEDPELAPLEDVDEGARPDDPPAAVPAATIGRCW